MSLLPTLPRRIGHPPLRSGPSGRRPLVIAHRGASGSRPEHTLAAYRLAVESGADFIEPDLVPSRDGVLVARHENELSATTDVAQRRAFADRFASRRVNGRLVRGWFVEDFTLAELKQLRARERFPGLRAESSAYDGEFEIPTFDEILVLLDESRRAGSQIGLCPELKTPSYFRYRNLAVEPMLVSALERWGLNRTDGPVQVQSFQASTLCRLSRDLHVPLVQLVDRGAQECCPLSSSGLDGIASYARAVNVHRGLVLSGRRRDTGVVRRAHAAGLRLHVWTLRNENRFLSRGYRSGGGPERHGNAAGEIRAFLDAGVDGIFTDHPHTGVQARDAWLAASATSPRRRSRPAHPAARYGRRPC